MKIKRVKKIILLLFCVRDLCIEIKSIGEFCRD